MKKGVFVGNHMIKKACCTMDRPNQKAHPATLLYALARQASRESAAAPPEPLCPALLSGSHAAFSLWLWRSAFEQK